MSLASAVGLQDVAAGWLTGQVGEVNPCCGPGLKHHPGEQNRPAGNALLSVLGHRCTERLPVEVLRPALAACLSSHPVRGLSVSSSSVILEPSSCLLPAQHVCLHLSYLSQAAQHPHEHTLYLSVRSLRLIPSTSSHTCFVPTRVPGAHRVPPISRLQPPGSLVSFLNLQLLPRI